MEVNVKIIGLLLFCYQEQPNRNKRFPQLSHGVAKTTLAKH